MKYLIPAVALIAAMPICAQPPAQQNPAQMFIQNFDADKDGKVSKDEYVKPQVQNIEKQFDYLDKNKDGQVDSGEADAFADEMRQRAEQMKKQYEGQKRP